MKTLKLLGILMACAASVLSGCGKTDLDKFEVVLKVLNDGKSPGEEGSADISISMYSKRYNDTFHFGGVVDFDAAGAGGDMLDFAEKDEIGTKKKSKVTIISIRDRSVLQSLIADITIGDTTYEAVGGVMSDCNYRNKGPNHPVCFVTFDVAKPDVEGHGETRVLEQAFDIFEATEIQE